MASASGDLSLRSPQMLTRRDVIAAEGDPAEGGREVSWVNRAVWWHVYPLGFVGAEKELGALQTGVSRLPRLQGWLEHLTSWGGNGLLLGPVFTSSSHGYDTVDYFQIDPRLGDDADFDALVEACRERGVRLLLDGVFNHAGRDFPPVARALAEGPGSDAHDWVSQLYDTDGVTLPTTSRAITV